MIVYCQLNAKLQTNSTTSYFLSPNEPALLQAIIKHRMLTGVYIQLFTIQNTLSWLSFTTSQFNGCYFKWSSRRPNGLRLPLSFGLPLFPLLPVPFAGINYRYLIGSRLGKDLLNPGMVSFPTHFSHIVSHICLRHNTLESSQS